MIQEKIISLLDRSNGWGKACNQIQDAAFETFSAIQWNTFAARQEKDYNECEGSDFLIMNGHYFDWKEFEIKENEIILAYLSYFTDSQLEKIYKYLCSKKKQAEPKAKLQKEEKNMLYQLQRQRTAGAYITIQTHKTRAEAVGHLARIALQENPDRPYDGGDKWQNSSNVHNVNRYRIVPLEI